MKEFMSKFYVRTESYYEPVLKYEGDSIIETNNSIQNHFLLNYDIKFKLRSHPWKCLFLNTKENLKYYYQNIMNNYSEGWEEETQNRITFPINTIDNFDTVYPYLFIKRHTFYFLTHYPNNGEINIVFAIGKRQNGFYHLLCPCDFLFRNMNELINHFKYTGIT